MLPMDRWRPFSPNASAPAGRVLAWLSGMTLAVLLTLFPLRPSFADQLGMLGSVLSRASFQFDGGPSREVELPHTWALDGLPTGGRGHYRMELDLPRLPDIVWALGADRMSSRCAIRINGSLIHGALPLRDTGQHAAPIWTYVDVPAGFLRVGRNTIEIDMEFGARGGMSPLRVGPAEWVRVAYARSETFGFTVPQSLNVGATVLAIFMLTIWVRRRSETELGAFCGLMAVVSIRNVVTTGVGNAWHGIEVNIFLFVANVASMVLLAYFAMAFARRDWPVFRRLARGVGAALIVGGPLLILLGAGFTVRVWAYPVVLVLILPSVWLIILGAKANRGWHQIALTVAILMLVGAAWHDYFFLRGTTSVMDLYWMPLTSPLALLIFSSTLLHRLVGALGSMETQASELERKVADRTRELEVANAAKTRFLAAASHDLRQPVVSISLLSELLREQPLPTAVVPILARIGDSVRALNGLLKGLLDLSRFDAGVVQVRKARVALRPLIDRVLADEAESARRKGIALRSRAATGDIQSDPVLLEQILRNLVSNAVRYTRSGGVLVSARRRGSNHILLQVWDTGPGIPAGSHDQVFDEFVQLENEACNRAGGLGLGLSLVRRAAGVLGVQVALRSAVGRGSCFSVELPLAGFEPTLNGVASAARASLHGSTVWVVEDDPEVREALRLRLIGWGASVLDFGNVAAVRRALADVAGTLPDLLVTDQRLPDGTGVDVVELLHAAAPTLQVLVVTGDTAPGDIARLRATGLTVLHKPFTSDELLCILDVLGATQPQAISEMGASTTHSDARA
jgi:signal transduction histidine kinase/ActR/RegA family two-component response regulator